MTKTLTTEAPSLGLFTPCVLPCHRLLLPTARTRCRYVEPNCCYLCGTTPHACVRAWQVVSTVTGAYAGLGVMFVIPSFLVLYARHEAKRMDGSLMASLNTSPGPDVSGFGINASAGSIPPSQTNPLASPFRSKVWIYFILIASLGIAVFNTYELATNGV